MDTVDYVCSEFLILILIFMSTAVYRISFIFIEMIEQRHCKYLRHDWSDFDKTLKIDNFKSVKKANLAVCNLKHISG